MAPPKVLVVDDNQELLNLLSRLFEDAGYQVLAANKGKTALDMARADKPALAVLDILLPDMMGYHLAENLKKEFGTPVIFLTGVFKGGKHALDAKAKYNAVAYFEKPFEAGKLIDTAKSVVAPEPKTAAQQAAADEAEEPFEVELDIDVDEERPQDPMELTGVVRVMGDGSVSAVLKGQSLVAQGGRPGAAAVVRPPPASMPSAPKPVTEAEKGTRRGDLRDNLPSLITAFYQSQETGELGVQRGKVKKVVYFEHGQPVFALSNLVTDRFGQFLMRVGKINETQLKQATDIASTSKRRTGDVLIELGYLKETERLYYVGQQVKSIIYSLFGWEDGVYTLAFKKSATKESIKLDVHPANLIMRGVKKLYKPERLRRLLAPEDRVLPSLQPAYALNEIELERWEAELLPKVDGTRTVAEIVAISGRPENVVHAFLYGLVALSVLERRA